MQIFKIDSNIFGEKGRHGGKQTATSLLLLTSTQCKSRSLFELRLHVTGLYEISLFILCTLLVYRYVVYTINYPHSSFIQSVSLFLSLYLCSDSINTVFQLTNNITNSTYILDHSIHLILLHCPFDFFFSLSSYLTLCQCDQ